MRSVGFKSQYEWGRAEGSGPQTIKYVDFNENDPAGITNLTNPCPNHLNKEISFIVKTVKKGVCDVCV